MRIGTILIEPICLMIIVFLITFYFCKFIELRNTHTNPLKRSISTDWATASSVLQVATQYFSFPVFLAIMCLKNAVVRLAILALQNWIKEQDGIKEFTRHSRVHTASNKYTFSLESFLEYKYFSRSLFS